MPLYETTFIARQDLPRQDVAKLAESMSAIVENGGGKVLKNEYWGLKSLSYRIAKNRKGHYTMLASDASPAAVKEMERNLAINEDVIRQLTVRVDALPEGPSAMMQQSRSRDDYTPETGESASPAEPTASTEAETQE